MTTSKKSFGFLLLTLLVATGLSVPSTVDAFTIETLNVELLNDFVLEPAKNEVIINPGEEASRTLSLTNRTERTITFKIDIEDLVGSDDPEDQIKLLGDEEGPYSLKDFLIPEAREFTLEPGEKMTQQINVSLPSDSTPGGYYGAIILSSAGEEKEAVEADVSGKTKIITRIASLFLVRVSGETEESSSVSTFKAIGPGAGVYSSHPEGFEVAIKNEGSVHLVHYGEVVITNMFGKTITSLPMDAFFSLPKSTRLNEALWEDSFTIGYYKASLEIYKGYGDDDNLDSASISFWVLPWQVVLPALAVIILIILLINFLKKNFKIAKK